MSQAFSNSGSHGSPRGGPTLDIWGFMAENKHFFYAHKDTLSYLQQVYPNASFSQELLSTNKGVRLEISFSSPNENPIRNAYEFKNQLKKVLPSETYARIRHGSKFIPEDGSARLDVYAEYNVYSEHPDLPGWYVPVTPLKISLKLPKTNS